MSSNTSIIDDPRFSKWVKNFDINDPEFLKILKKRKQASEAYFSGLEKQAKRIDRKTNWHVPVKSRERS